MFLGVFWVPGFLVSISPPYKKNHFLGVLCLWFSSMLHVTLVQKGDLTYAYEDG